MNKYIFKNESLFELLNNEKVFIKDFSGISCFEMAIYHIISKLNDNEFLIINDNLGKKYDINEGKMMCGYISDTMKRLKDNFITIPQFESELCMIYKGFVYIKEKNY